MAHRPPNPAAHSVSSAEIRQVIVRACTECGAPRQLDTACAKCGNSSAPETSDLGVISAVYKNPFRQAWWHLVRRPLAHRRIQRANRRAHQLRADEE